ncbi:NADH-quinone oxidoreductase subunit NuoE [Methylophaga nitratireducenticrescens]|uniref:NADH-quinone oxidoreductase subunit E n=1 Tax=Methylophaga nitratireducenticrescens TaxID=754476 RepID=I1XMN9_METNJ|nr:NADH-quinone oxidoreductase subunit NuoE [Methylophaga nitratireducenticrescens]AFI85658.1 NAD(P)H-dependent oxidoreductase subunit E [Methylophaga nitratireducenticrescens]AUZ85385.1 NAD(P)H-dependent oxidoreductase subunit E [Methylophaga nitratireducenticrescens]
MTEMLQLTGHKDQLFNETVRQQLDNWISKYPPGQPQSAVIPCLHILQNVHEGWLSEGLMRALADYLGIPAISVFEVATFYTMFELKPVGQHKISLCTNISCQLCGSQDIARRIQKKLGIGFGQTTADGKFTLKEVECLGACVGAPMLLLDHDYHEHLTEEKIDALLDGVK